MLTEPAGSSQYYEGAAMHLAYRTSLCRIASTALLICLAAVFAPAATSPLSARPAMAASTFTTAITTSHTSVVPGQPITVKVQLKNETTDRCFGMLQFRLYVETAPGVWQDINEPIFTPARPDPVTVSTGLQPGQSITVTFALTAARPGTVTFYTTASGEGTGPNCQPPFYWSGATPSRSPAVAVTNTATYLPFVMSTTAAQGMR
jgi:hypothetical protein